MNRTKVNYIIDIVIGLSFLVAAVSGFVLLFAGSGGYQGGRNSHYLQNILFISRFTWKDIHTWSTIIMTAGVAAHLVTHWKWMVCMTRNIFKGLHASRKEAAACPIEG